MSRCQHFDVNTLYVTSGVARADQLEKCLSESIQDVLSRIKTLKEFEENYDSSYDSNDNDIYDDENYIGLDSELELDPSFRTNLIVDRNGKLFGYGYIYVTSPEIYWMLLGRNPDGTERYSEYKDPDWIPPLPKEDNKDDDNHSETKLSWAEMIQEEEKYIHPTIKETLPPLMKIPGYTYDPEQYEHLRQVEIENDKIPDNVPKMGFFELSRAYVKNIEVNKCSHKLCARYVPDWIPDSEFKRIFKFYVYDKTKKVIKKSNSNKNKNNKNSKNKNEDDTYPVITSIQSKNQGRIVFVMFDPTEKDGLFALLMTRKVNITHPKDPSKKCTLIFDHAYENLTNLNHDDNRRNDGNRRRNDSNRRNNRNDDNRDRNDSNRNNDDNRNRNDSNSNRGNNSNRRNNDDNRNRNDRRRTNNRNDNQNKSNNNNRNQNNDNRNNNNNNTNKSNNNNTKKKENKTTKNDWNQVGSVNSKKKDKTRDIW